MVEMAIGGHGVEEILDTVESIYLDSITGNAVIFELAAQFAMLHGVETVEGAGGSGRVLVGTERAVRLGGSGTPLVAEFAAAEFGPRIQLGTFATKRYFADVLDVAYRLPLIWARVRSRQVKVSYARHVAQETRHLGVAEAGFVDAAVAAYVDGRRPWTLFVELVAAKIIEADPELAADRENEAACKQFARAARSSRDGMKGFYLRSTTALVTRFDATVAYLAEALRALGDTDSEDFRRAKACAIMANPTQAVELMVAFAAHRAQSPDLSEHLPCDDPELPLDPQEVDAVLRTEDAHALIKPRPFAPGKLTEADLGFYRYDGSKLLPAVTLYVHLSQESLERDEGGVARWEGEGPLSVQYVRDHLAPHHTFVIKPVIDLAGQAPVDAYEVPERHREAVHLRSPADIFPFSTSTDRRVDIDHTVPYVPPEDGGPPGQSRLENYGPLARFHHRIKTHGAWDVRQPFNGIFVWRDPHGVFYLVDHTGTRKTIAPPGVSAHGRPRQTTPGSGQLEAQVWEATDTLEYTPTHAAC
jgi:hypothetical protein